MGDRENIEQRLRRLEEQAQPAPKFGILPNWGGYGSLAQYEHERQEAARADAAREADTERRNAAIRIGAPPNRPEPPGNNS